MRLTEDRCVAGQSWFRDLDSNQDTQLQRLMSYQLDDPGNVLKFYQSSAEPPIRVAARRRPRRRVGQSAATTRSCLFVRRCELSAKLVER